MIIKGHQAPKSKKYVPVAPQGSSGGCTKQPQFNRFLQNTQDRHYQGLLENQQKPLPPPDPAFASGKSEKSVVKVISKIKSGALS